MHHKHGFTLVEIAIVIFILGLMIAGLVGPFEVQMEARYRRETLDMMNDAADALYGYALTNRRLPCPDSDGDGLPNPAIRFYDQGECDLHSGQWVSPVVGTRRVTGGCLGQSIHLPGR